MRLIDADALKGVMIETLERIKANPKMDTQEMHILAAFHAVGLMIDDAPTVDAVPVMTYPQVDGLTPTVVATHDMVRVVRCKECKYYQKVYGGVPLGEVGHCVCHSFESVPDWYCADGEKR